MKAALPALLLMLAVQAGAQSFISMGRLFTTPGERAQLDMQRNQSPAATAGSTTAPGSIGLGAAAGAAGAGGAAYPGGMTGAGSADGAAGAGGVGGATGMSGAAGADGASGTNVAAGALADGAPGLRLDGIIRRSSGRDVIIVNGEVKPAPARGVLRGTVRLDADGRAILLKPGQRFDPATGVIHEAAR